MIDQRTGFDEKFHELHTHGHTSTHRGFHYQVSSLAAAEMHALRIWIVSVLFSPHGRDAQEVSQEKDY